MIDPLETRLQELRKRVPKKELINYMNIETVKSRILEGE